MPISNRSLVYPGLPVSVVLKADQRSGRLTQGTVADVLTRHNHPRGIKVRLQDGAVGRIEAIRSTQPGKPQFLQSATKHNSSSANQHIGQRTMSQQPSTNPWADQASQGGHAAGYYGQQQQPPSQQQFQDPPGQQHQQQQQGSVPPNRAQNDGFLPQGQERSEQVETMQNYEARAPKSEDDKAQEQLQKEFPSLDSSLIAAIYGDTKDVAQTREMLQELGSST